jgi:integrase
LSLKRLTDLLIQQLPAPANGQKVYYEPTGLGIRISQGGSKTFVVQVGRQRRRLTIGKYPKISLKDARTEAVRLLGRDVSDEPNFAISEALGSFLEYVSLNNRPRTVSDYRRLLTRHFPTGRMRELTKSNLARRLDMLKRTPAEQAHATAAFQVFLNWCVNNGYLDVNPIAGLRNQGRIRKRERVLSDDELKTIWNALGGDRFSIALRVLILTGQRRGEIAHITIDGDLAKIPASYTKNGREHVFPVGELTKRYFEPIAFNGWSKSKRMLDAKSGVSNWTLHDLRRTFASNHARLGTPIHIVEKLLNHVSGSLAGVAGIYNRYSYQDEMRAAVHAYEAWLQSTLLAG